jgi:hypothetical protein
MKFISPTKYNCDKCSNLVPAYYTLSHITKGLWVQCSNCGTHARPYIDNLPLYYKPSKNYLRRNLSPTTATVPAKGEQETQLFK